MRRLEEIYHRFSDRVAFFLVYTREAHPTDGWQVESNVQEGVLYRQHQALDEREAAATACSLDMRITFPILVDGMDNVVDRAYGASPERLYLIGADGKVAYKGRVGPFFFDPNELEQAIESYLRTLSD